MSSNTRAEVKAGTLCGSRLVTSPARARIRVPPFFGAPLVAVVAVAPGPAVGAHAESTVATTRIAAPMKFNRRNITIPPRAVGRTVPPHLSLKAPHRGALDRQQQTAIRYDGAMPFIRGDEDAFPWSSGEWSGLELDDERTADDEQELIAVLPVPLPIEPTAAGMEHDPPIDR